MLRRILLGAVMLVSVLIIVVALQKYHQAQLERSKPRADKGPLVPAGPTGIEIRKYDKITNNLVAVVRGLRAQQTAEQGPVDILKPVVTLFRGQNEFTFITADTGRMEGTDQDQIKEGWLKGNVVMTVLDRAHEDNTLITCDEMKYFGDKGQVFIPGALHARNKTLDLTGVQLTTDQGLSVVRIERDVRMVMKDVSGMQGALAAPAPAGKPATEPAPPPEPPKPLTITCEGALEFRSAERRATFQQEVRAVQGDTPEDRRALRADLMVVDLQPATPPATDATAPAPAASEPSGLPSGSFSVRRIVTTSLKKDGVVVEGPNFQGWGDRFEFDAREGSILYSGSPCRATQKSQGQSIEIEGAEIQYGRKRLLSQAEVMPEGMTENAAKILVKGKPATVHSIPEQGEPIALTGERILIDQDSRVVWLDGAADRRAVAVQGKSRIEGVQVLLTQKTETRPERAAVKGPGRLDTPGRTDASGGEGKPSFVEFQGDMIWAPGENVAHFTGGTRFSDGDTVCTSRLLDVEFAEGTNGGSREMSRMVAGGDVVVTGSRMDAKADTLVYGFVSKESKVTKATLTAKPGETCEAKQDNLYCRAPRIEIDQTPPPEGAPAGTKAAMTALLTGAGFVHYVSTPKEGEAPSSFDVRFAKSGSYDDAKLKSVFEGDVKVTRANMDLRGKRVVMDYVRTPQTDASGKATTKLDLAAVDAFEDVTLVDGQGDQALTATGEQLVWNRLKNTAALCGSDKGPAHVVRDKNDMTAPRMDARLKNDSIESIVTTGGGHVVTWTQSSIGVSSKPAEPAPEGAEKPLKRMDVTWAGEGFYKKLDAKDPAVDATAFMRVKEKTKAVSEDSECTGDTLMIYMGPPAAAKDAGTADGQKGLKLEARLAYVVGNARATSFNPDKKLYRYAKGDTLTWDRIANRMVVYSEAGEAVVWDDSNEWTGKELVVNRGPEGKYEMESTSGRRLTFYDEGGAKVPPPEDSKQWKPIY